LTTTLLSSESCARLDALFRRAGAANLGLATQRRPKIVAVSPPRPAAADCLGVLAFTITSFRFRLVVMLGVNPGVLEWDDPDPQAGRRAAIDALAERGNMACGEMARGLARDVRHVGLSTPTWLRASASTMLVASAPEHLSAFEIGLDSGAHLDAWLALRAYAPIEFGALLEAPAGTAGELELF
jgi:hypothetical protein